MPDEWISSIKIYDYGITPYLSHYATNKIRRGFDGGCLKQVQSIIPLKEIVNIYVVYKITNNFNIVDYLIQENCLFGAVKLTKSDNIDKHGHSGYGIGFDRHGSFSFPGTGLSRNVIISRVDMASSKIDKKKDILILRKGPTQGLEHRLSAEKMYLINFTDKNKKFSLSLHYNGTDNYLFIMAPKLLNLNQKTLKLFHMH